MGAIETSNHLAEAALQAREQASDAFNDATDAAMPAARLTAVQRAVAAAEDDPTLDNLANDLCERLGRDGVVNTLIRAALSCGPTVAGQMLLDLINKGVELEAENLAIREVESAEEVV